MKPKTKYCKLGIACILVFLLIAGCASKDRIDSGPRPVSQTPAQGENQMVAGPAGGTGYVAPVVEEQSTPVEVSADVGEQQKARDEIGLTDTGIEQTKSLQTGRYCYDTMDAQYHTLYVELLTIVENSQENIRISTDNADALQYAFLCMFYDHPEIFWIDGYTYMRHEDSTGSYFTFSGRYTYTREESAGYQLALDQYFAQVQATIPANASQYEKVKGVYEYIVRHTEYDPTARDNQNILSVFLYGKSVCQGYVKAMQYLLERLGVASTMVVGRVATGEGHAWNLVNIDGAYYYVDPTWGDSSYSADNAAVAASDQEVNYEFLNITTAELERTHQSTNVVPLPCCVATEANYYVMENLYFAGYDEEHLSAVFDDAYASGERFVTIKCSDEAVYQNMYNELLTNQGILDYLPSDVTSIEYVTSEDQRTMSFWL